MKSAQFTVNKFVYKSGIDKHPAFLESKQLAREINLLIEGKQLGTDAIHNLFTGVEQQMTAGGQNKTLLGKGAAAVGAVGAKIAGLGQWLKDTTFVQGVDDTWAEIRQAAASKLEKSPGGSTVLRNIDKYRQLVQKYPQTSKFFWNAAAVVGGLVSGGMAVPAILGAMKGIDALVQGKEFSSAVGQGLGQFGKTSAVMGAKNLAISAANAADNITNPFAPTDTPTTGGAGQSGYHDPVYDPPSAGGDPSAGGGRGFVNPPNVVPSPDLATVTVAKGDTLSQIAQANQTSVKALMQANPHITNPDALLPGTQVALPPINSTTYMGGVGTASDTAAGVASGKFTDIPTALANQRAAMMRENVLAAIGFTAIRLPMNEMVDKYSTVRTWALNESLGHKGNRSLQLTDDGVNVVLYNIEKIHEHVLKEAATDRPESQTPEAEAKRQARAQARAGNPANTSTTAGPVGKLPGGLAPAGNTMPYLAADPEGKFDTKNKGAVGNKFVDKVEGGLKRAGNWLSGKFKSATTKFEANRAKRRLTDAGIGNDSDAIAKWLVSDQKVPQDIVTALYQQLGFPAPAGMQAAGGAEAGADAGTAAAGGSASASGTDALGTGEIPGRNISRSDYRAQQQAERLAQRNAQGGGPTPKQEKAAVKDFQADADSLIRDLLNMSNVTQPAYVKYIRDRLSQHFPDAAAAPVAAPVANAADAADKLKPKGVPTPPTTEPEKIAAESRRRFGGKYVRESAVDKMHKDFEHFVNSIG